MLFCAARAAAPAESRLGGITSYGEINGGSGDDLPLDLKQVLSAAHHTATHVLSAR